MRNGKRDAQSPPIIYLPSSGGFGGSRFAPELITRKRFPLRRYSIQEDGSVVVREKHVNRDTRPSPYTKPTVRFSTTPYRAMSPDPESTSIRLASTSTPAPTPNPTLTVEVLKSLVPALVEDPTSFEESISSIFAAHNIDESTLSSVIQAARRRSSSRPPDRSTPSAFTASVSPTKQERPFSSGSPGVTAWYSSCSLTTLRAPPLDLDPNVGDLYVHNDRAQASYDVWLYGLDRTWMLVDAADKVHHPVIADRVLSMRANGTPSWITAASYTTIKGRKEKEKARASD